MEHHSTKRIWKTFKYEDLFTIGDLMVNEKIKRETAVAFFKIDQNNPPRDFKDKDLALVQRVYTYAKKNNLKKIGNYIHRYMLTLAALSETSDPHTSQELKKLVASFV